MDGVGGGQLVAACSCVCVVYLCEFVSERVEAPLVVQEEIYTIPPTETGCFAVYLVKE